MLLPNFKEKVSARGMNASYVVLLLINGAVIAAVCVGGRPVLA